jgi:hypothetical protein
VNTTDTTEQGPEDLIIEAMTGRSKPSASGETQARDERAPFGGLGLALLALGLLGSRLSEPAAQ